jgi:hypothetical protein
MRLISNVGRDTSCRVLFKTLNILPLTCLYIMEIICCIKMNVGMLEQNSVRHNYYTCYRANLQSQFYRTDTFKNSVNYMWIKVCNKLPNHLKNPENRQLIRKKLKLFLLQHTFYSINEYLLYEYLSWKM